MSYVTADFCKRKQPEPCLEVSRANPSALVSAIIDSDDEVDAFLKTLGIDSVPLTDNDITDYFQKAVVHWVAAIIYYDNNNVEQGDRWRHLAETMIKRFKETHDFADTDTSIPSKPEHYQYSEDIDDWKEPRDV